MNIITLIELEKITGKYYTKDILKSMIGNGWHWSGIKSVKVTRKTFDDKKYFSIDLEGVNHENNNCLVRC